MPTTKLKDALKNCLINFDRRINVTDLLQQYALSYQDVHQLLEQHLQEQEAKGVKYEKRFLVQGLEKDSSNEVYTVVQGEQKLQEWLARLQQAQSTLYTVEIAGGAKSPACLFKPLERAEIKLQSLEVREVKTKSAPATSMTNGNVTNDAAAKADPKPEPKKSAAMTMFGKQGANAASTSKSSAAPAEQPKKSPPSAKKTSPETKKQAAEEKKAKAAAVTKKGIGNFFAPAAKKEDNKKEDSKKDVKHSSPQKMQDFFKKQAEKPKTETTTNKEIPVKSETSCKKSTPPKPAVKVEANTSVQLFNEDSSDASSDEETKLEALKRNIISSDHEMDTESVEQADDAPSSSNSTNNKRRRIVDSSDEEDVAEAPKKKLERHDSETVVVNISEDDVKEEPLQSETYLDEDGFVITIKPKKAAATKSSSTKANKKSPPKHSPRKSPRKPAATKSAVKPAAAAAPKTKQGNIMSFFTKK